MREKVGQILLTGTRLPNGIRPGSDALDAVIHETLFNLGAFAGLRFSKLRQVMTHFILPAVLSAFQNQSCA